MPLPRLFACVLLALAATGPSGQAQSSAEFAQIFQEFRTGDADRAVRTFATWDEAKVTREVVPPSVSDRPWDAAAFVLLHLEAGIQNGWFGKARPELVIVDMARLESAEAHLRQSRPLVQQLFEIGSLNDPRPIQFARLWFLAADAEMAWGRGGWYRGQPPVERWFPKDSEVQLRLAANLEYWSGPRSEFGPVVFDPLVDVFDSRSQAGVTTPHGTFNSERIADAQKRLRQALEVDPNLAEARLRLGRLSFFLNRQRDADVELSRAAADATTTHDMASAYLAELMLGRLESFRGRLTEAASHYRAASDIAPDGLSARIGLGHTLLLDGQTAEGWTAIRRIFGEPGSPARIVKDPWSGYAAQHWRLDGRLAAMRAMVSTQPRSRATPAPLGSPLQAPARAPSASEPPRAPDAPSRTPFRIGVDGVVVAVSVLRDKVPVAGLTASNFELQDNGVKQTIDSIDSTGPLNMAIVVDTSSSSSRSAWAMLTRAVDAIVGSMTAGDTSSLVGVSDRVQLVADAVDGASTRQALLSVHPDPFAKTALWDGVLAASSLVVDRGPRPVVVVLSDGADNASWCDRPCALEALRRSGLVIDSIEVPLDATRDTWYGDWFHGPVTLRPLRDLTNGSFIEAGDTPLEAKVAARLAVLRSTYLLTFQPKGVKKGDGWHKLSVKLKNASGDVSARAGYQSGK